MKKEWTPQDIQEIKHAVITLKSYGVYSDTKKMWKCLRLLGYWFFNEVKWIEAQVEKAFKDEDIDLLEKALEAEIGSAVEHIRRGPYKLDLGEI